MSQPDLTSIASSPPTYDLCDQGDKVGEPGSRSESLLQFDLEFKQSWDDRTLETSQNPLAT